MATDRKSLRLLVGGVLACATLAGASAHAARPAPGTLGSERLELSKVASRETPLDHEVRPFDESEPGELLHERANLTRR